MLGLPLAQLLGGDRIGQRAAGLEVGNQHALVRAQDRGRLGHEVDATEDDQLAVGGSRLLGEPERVADVVGDVLDLGELVVVREDHRPALARQRAHFVLQRGDVLEHQRCVGRTEHRKVHVSGSRMRERSKAGALCVNAPTDTKFTPVARGVPERLEREPPARLRLRSARDPRHRLTQLLRGHVVEQDPRRAGLERLVYLCERPRLDLQREPGCVRGRRPYRGPDPARERSVVLLDQDRVVQPGAMVRPAAGRHRRLFQSPQPRRRLARIEDPRARALDRLHRAGAERRHPGQPPEKVQRGPLGGQQRSRRTLHPQHRPALLPPHALAYESIERRVRIELPEYLFGHVEPEDHARRLLRDQRPRAGVLRHGGCRRHVAIADVLGERPLDQIFELLCAHCSPHSTCASATS